MNKPIGLSIWMKRLLYCQTHPPTQSIAPLCTTTASVLQNISTHTELPQQEKLNFNIQLVTCYYFQNSSSPIVKFHLGFTICPCVWLDHWCRWSSCGCGGCFLIKIGCSCWTQHRLCWCESCASPFYLHTLMYAWVHVSVMSLFCGLVLIKFTLEKTCSHEAFECGKTSTSCTNDAKCWNTCFPPMYFIIKVLYQIHPHSCLWSCQAGSLSPSFSTHYLLPEHCMSRKRGTACIRGKRDGYSDRDCTSIVMAGERHSIWVRNGSLKSKRFLKFPHKQLEETSYIAHVSLLQQQVAVCAYRGAASHQAQVHCIKW